MSTAISWTSETWNPSTGCTRVSDGCRFCYAERLSLQKKWSEKPWTAQNEQENFKIHQDRLRKPLSWRKPKLVFVNSMSDLFHHLMPRDFLTSIFEVMNEAERHIFQVLTKRPERARRWPGPWSQNIWLGTSVENQKALSRLDDLRASAALNRFLSLEPLLEDLGPLDLQGIGWVIVGGESGNNFRPMDHAWARNIRDQCVEQGVPFFFKQSAALRTETGTKLREADGSMATWHQFPEAMVIR